MKIIGKSVIQKVINKVLKSPEVKNEATNLGHENSGKVIYLKDRRPEVDAFYKQAEKVKTELPATFFDDDAPARIKPFVSAKCGYFERNI